MSPDEINALSPLIAFLTISGIISIPVIAFSLRFAAKPVVDALARLREAQGRNESANETLLLHDRRMSLLETELQHMSATLDKLAEAQRFHAELAAPRAEERALYASVPDTRA
jgi:hypothetical protein